MTPGNTGTLIGQSLGGYELLSLLGAGGMAEVYRAKDPKLDREVAVKVLPASLALDPGYVERFRDEARRVAALNHPNVVPVYHYGEENGLLFLIMPVLRESLRDRMERDGLLPVSEATRYVVQVAAALDAAHAQGLVHRDVKPENILINPDGRAMLTDFGIAREASFLKRTGSNRTLAATGLPVGTPEYMAPEQLRAGIVDQRADIYALGAVLYELLTGTVPHEAATPYEVAALVLTAPLTPPSRRNPAIWPQLEQVVMKALASDPNGRYSNTRAFAMAVRDAVLHRDSSVSRLTMPAVSSEIPTLAALASLPTLATTPDSGSPTGPDEGAPMGASIPGPFGGSRFTWRKGFQPQSLSSRRTLLIVAAAALVLVGICGGGSLALLNGFTLPLIGTSIQSPFATSNAPGGTDTTANATTTTSGITLVTPGVTATVPAPTSTAIPPTATPTPPAPLSFSPQTIVASPQGGKMCSGQQQITNNTSLKLRWAWQGPQPNHLNFQLFSITRSNGTTRQGLWPPNEDNMPPNSTDMLTVFVNCPSQTTTYNITVKNTTPGFGETYSITLEVQANGS